MDIEEAANQYLLSIDNDTTRRCYRAAIGQFVEHMNLVDQVTIREILSYKRALEEEDKSAQTICARLAAIRGFTNMCWTSGWLEFDPSMFVDNVPNPRYTKSKIMDANQFRRILNSIYLNCDGIHDYLLLKLISVSGSADKVSRLNWNAKLPKFAETLNEVYKASAVADPNLRIKKSGYLFFPFAYNNSFCLTPEEILNILKTRAEQAGYDQDQFDIMSLKRLRAKEIYESTKSVEEVKKFCGFKHKKDAIRFVKTL